MIDCGGFVQIQAFAKINLFLEVLGKRPDNYHTIRSVKQSVSLCDVLDIIIEAETHPAETSLVLSCNHPDLPTDGRNLVYRAAAYMMERFGIHRHVRIHIDKYIPVAAGLGGGSSDCAAALVGMNRLAGELGLGQKLTMEELRTVGLTFGADVPFCVTGGTMLAQGVGEELTELPAHPSCWIVLACLPISVSTEAVFNQSGLILNANQPKQNRFEPMNTALAAGETQNIAAALYNDLTQITASMHPEVQILINNMKKLGASNALMSGSGPSVFGYFASEPAAQKAADVLKKSITNVYITQPEGMKII
jgi:4-diphosphocytidyl-2-C-methyl-D-erythritol kinase